MTGETNLNTLIKSIKPVLNSGEYVFCTVSIQELETIAKEDILSFFREQEGITLVVKKDIANQYNISYSFVAAWITLTVHSSLAAVGLTAAFSKVLADNGISCNVMAAFYHDHIFVEQKHAEKAISILEQLSRSA